MHSRRIVWRIDRSGSLSRLKRVEEDVGPPGEGEAQIAVRAVGLNFADLLACQGLYSATPRGSFIPGLEIAGRVTALGPRREDSARPLSVGDRVIALTRFGGYASVLNADVRYLEPLPAGWSLEQGAAYPVQALTAWYGLIGLGQARRGSLVLVQSAAGGVGLNALAILRHLGARAVAVVGSEAKIAFLEREFAVPRSAIVLRDSRRYGTALDAALKAGDASGFDIVFDAVLGAWFKPQFQRLAPEGRYVLYGAADFMSSGARPSWLHLASRWLQRPRLDPLAMIAENRALLAFNLIWLWQTIERVPAAYASLAALGLAPPHIGARYPFADAPRALEELQSGHTVGKSVLWIDDHPR